MLKTYSAEMKKGEIRLAEYVQIPDGARVLVTVLDPSEGRFWSAASQSAVDEVWGNEADDVYAKLLEE